MTLQRSAARGTLSAYTPTARAMYGRRARTSALSTAASIRYSYQSMSDRARRIPRPSGFYPSASRAEAVTASIDVVTALKAVLLPCAVSRGAVLLVGLIAAVVIGYDPPPNESALWRIAADPVRNLLA